MVGFLLSILLSVGAINALIPLALILILIVAAAGATRGYSLFNIFGMATLAGIGLGAGGMKGKTAMGRFFLFRTYSGQAGRLRKIPKSKVKSLAPAALVGRIHQFGAKVFSKGSDFAAMRRQLAKVEAPKPVSVKMGYLGYAVNRGGSKRAPRLIPMSIPSTKPSDRPKPGKLSRKHSYINLYGEELHPVREELKKNVRRLPFVVPFIRISDRDMASDKTVPLLYRGTFKGLKSTGKLNTTNWQKELTKVESLKNDAQKLLNQVQVIKSIREGYRRERDTLKEQLIRSRISELKKAIDTANIEAKGLKPNDPRTAKTASLLSELNKEYDILAKFRLESRNASREADRYISQYARRASRVESARSVALPDAIQTRAARFLELTSRLEGMEGHRVISDKTEAALVAAIYTLDKAVKAERAAVSKFVTAEQEHQRNIDQINADLADGNIERKDADAKIHDADLALRQSSDAALKEFHTINHQFESRTRFFVGTEKHPITALIDSTSSQLASARVKTWNAWPALGTTISTFYKVPLERQRENENFQSDLQQSKHINDNRGFSQDLLIYYLNKFGPKRASRSNK